MGEGRVLREKGEGVVVGERDVGVNQITIFKLVVGAPGIDSGHIHTDKSNCFNILVCCGGCIYFFGHYPHSRLPPVLQSGLLCAGGL